MEGDSEVSVVDSTQRLKWVVSKEAFDNCVFPQRLTSPVFSVHVGKQKSKWEMTMCPNGYCERNKGDVLLGLRLHPVRPGDVKYTVQCVLGVKSKDAFHPDTVEDLYANKGIMEKEGKLVTKVFNGNATQEERKVQVETKKFGSKKNFRKRYLSENKFTLVATLVIYVEGVNYIHHRELARNFMANHRSMSDLDMFSDFMIVCKEKQFKCHRNVLASMSMIFNTMITNNCFLESTEKVVEIVDSSPDVVEAMLFFMTNGIIPHDIDAKAFDLITLANKYDLPDLKKACERSLVNNMTVENVIETLIIIDLYIPQSVNRPKIIEFVKSNAIEVTEAEDWTKFVQNYPKLVTEVFRELALKANAKP